METINITALRHSAFYSPLLVTIRGGYLENEGLTANYEPSKPTDSVPDAIREGRYHLSQSAVATSFAELNNGKQCDIVHFAQINERDGFFIVSREARPDFQWTDLLQGKVIVDHFFQPMAMLKYGLHLQAMNYEDLQVIDAGDVNGIDQAFRSGEGGFVHLQGPAAQQLEQDGIGHVVAAVGDAVGPVAFSSLCASRDWLETDMASAFMNAYRKARQFVIDSSAENIADVVIEMLPGIHHEVLANTINTYKELGTWSESTEISHTAYEKLLDVFESSGGINARHPYTACVQPAP